METLTIAAAAQRANRSDRTLRNWLREGHVEAVRDADGKRVVVVASLDAYLATLNAAPVAQPEGWPEVAAELGKLRELLEQRDREIRSLEWRNGSLTGELEATRQQLRRLEAGPVAVATPQELPEPLPEGGQSSPEGAAEGGNRWARLRRWWARGGY